MSHGKSVGSRFFQRAERDPKTIRRGLTELEETADLDTSRVQEKGGRNELSGNPQICIGTRPSRRRFCSDAFCTPSSMPCTTLRKGWLGQGGSRVRIEDAKGAWARKPCRKTSGSRRRESPHSRSWNGWKAARMPTCRSGSASSSFGCSMRSLTANGGVTSRLRFPTATLPGRSVRQLGR